MASIPDEPPDPQRWHGSWWTWRVHTPRGQRQHFIRDLARRHQVSPCAEAETNPAAGMVWQRARGAYVWDESDRRYLDLTAGGGTAPLGHASHYVLRAATHQMLPLQFASISFALHSNRAFLAKELSELSCEKQWYDYKKVRSGDVFTTEWWQSFKALLFDSEAEAIYASIEIGLRAAGRPGLITFHGAGHCHECDMVTVPPGGRGQTRVAPRLPAIRFDLPFPQRNSELRLTIQKLKSLLRLNAVGAVLIEPIQVRAGVRIPEKGFLHLLRTLTEDAGVVLIYDERLTGLGRTGCWYAAEYDTSPADIVCLGRELAEGFPLGACVVRTEIVDKARTAAATSGWLIRENGGHPVGCAMALRQLEELKNCRIYGDLCSQACQLGHFLLRRLQTIQAPSGYSVLVRGRGLLAAVEILREDGTPAASLVSAVLGSMLRRGYLLMHGGTQRNVIIFTPPLTITERHLGSAVAALKRAIAESALITR